MQTTPLHALAISAQFAHSLHLCTIHTLPPQSTHSPHFYTLPTSAQSTHSPFCTQSTHSPHLCTIYTLSPSPHNLHTPHLCNLHTLPILYTIYTLSPPLHNQHTLPISTLSLHFYTHSPSLHNLALLLIFWPAVTKLIRTVNSSQKINTTNHKRE